MNPAPVDLLARHRPERRRHPLDDAHFRIHEKIGGGGMGVVYRAEDTRLGRDVVLKFLPVHLSSDDEARTRFFHEARALSTLDHPNIATIHGIGVTIDGYLYLVMPYYAGETLRDKIVRGPLPLAAALDYGVQMAHGLIAIHRADLVHRDIKSANIMVSEPGPVEWPHGLVKIVDFGLVKVKGIRLTQAGTKLGTTAYMSPEQARGDPVDHRTDIWSFGVVLYEMLAGRLPFDRGCEQATLYALLNEPPAPLRTRRADVSPALERIVATCLRKDPQARYPAMEPLLEALQRVSMEPACPCPGRHPVRTDPLPEHLLSLAGGY